MSFFEERNVGPLSIMKIEELSFISIEHLVAESKQAGFRFLERLVNEYDNGTNRFDHLGEALFGVFDQEQLVAIGGLNIDPTEQNSRVGRLRRFYVCEKYRRLKVGSFLLEHIVDEARSYFDVLVLNTDTEKGNRFYTSFGFKKDGDFFNASHYYLLKSEIDKEEVIW